jgi:hypothetical protein
VASSYHSTAQEVVGAQQGASYEDAYSPIDTSLFEETLALSMGLIAAMPNDPQACFMVPFRPQHVAEPSVGLGQDHYACSATHGANAIHADASSTQEDLVNTVAVHPAVPFVQPSLQGIRAVERSGPYTEVMSVKPLFHAAGDLINDVFIASMSSAKACLFVRVATPSLCSVVQSKGTTTRSMQ